MDGCPLGLGLVVEDKPTEFSCNEFLHYAVNMDFTSLSVDLTFSNTTTTQCQDVSTIFAADVTAMPFNVNLTTSEAPTAVSLNPAVTTVTIQDGRQLCYNKNSAIVHA